MSMFSPQERNLILGILAVLLLGFVVKSCRNRVTVEPIPKTVPTVPGEIERQEDTGPD